LLNLIIKSLKYFKIILTGFKGFKLTSQNMIEINSLTKRFGKITALNELNLSVKKGELLGIIGPNGAGKTTAIRIISCILHPDQGQVKVGGYNVLKNPLEIKSMIGYLPEEPNLYERFKAYDPGPGS